ncbi:hypothetical protein [Streptococcus merionis]|uniref:Uncharacterized protein n=1 Tax=Streptococcus merionis TaxID=400065 RepID=A0A239STT1_9STRE|nr:hypothetical protein [Streptococcus merionis]SNU88642.1 Uncharacterised protein [Streptococcus merionis]
MKKKPRLISIPLGIVAYYLLLSSFQLEQGGTQDLYRVIGEILVTISSLLFSLSNKQS